MLEEGLRHVPRVPEKPSRVGNAFVLELPRIWHTIGTDPARFLAERASQHPKGYFRR